jgi:hypothetical protein
MSVRKVAAVALVGTTVWAAAACDSPAPPNTSGGASVNAASTTECSNAPSALVGKDLKLAVGKVTAHAEGPVTVCAYAGRYEVLVRYQTGETPTEFTQARNAQANLHQSIGTVSGLGDTAYVASYTASGPVSNTLGSLKGQIAIFITSPTSLGAERTLMTDLLKKV